MKVAVIGSGNWGTTVAKLIAENVGKLDDFDKEVIMWVYEEIHENRKISEDINTRHINPKYLPGVQLPHNIRGRTTLEFEDIDVFVFCLPHQFVGMLRDVRFKQGAFGINLCKGLIECGGELRTPSEHISRLLGMECSCLMGANIASEVARGVLSDSTLGCASAEHADCLRRIFESEYFLPDLVEYNKGVEICGAVKNIISIAVGIAEGKKWGKNTLAMVFRRGLLEIERLCRAMGGTLNLLDSACIGDLLVSCLCGRNYRCGVEMGSKGLSVADFEASLNGQKLQGPDTARVVVEWLAANGHAYHEYPILYSVHRVCFEGKNGDIILDALRAKDQ